MALVCCSINNDEYKGCINNNYIHVTYHCMKISWNKYYFCIVIIYIKRKNNSFILFNLTTNWTLNYLFSYIVFTNNMKWFENSYEVFGNEINESYSMPYRKQEFNIKLNSWLNDKNTLNTMYKLQQKTDKKFTVINRFPGKWWY